MVESVDASRHIAIDRGIDRIAPRRDIADHAVRIRREEHIDTRHPAGDDVIDHREGNQRTLRDGVLTGRRPAIAQCGDQAAAADALQIGALRQWQWQHRAIRAEIEIIAVEEIGPAHDQRHGAIWPMENRRPGPDIAPLALIDRLRGGDGLPPPPQFDDAGVTGIGQRRRSLIGGEDDGLGIEIARGGFAQRQGKAALHECAFGGIIFADHHRIAAIGRQHHETAFEFGGAIRALPDKGFARLAVEGIEIEQGLPLRLAMQIIGNRRTAPQPARMILVLPEIAHMIAMERDLGDAAGRIQHRQQGVAVARECLARGEVTLRLLRLVLRPGERLCAMNIGEPEIGIGVWSSGLFCSHPHARRQAQKHRGRAEGTKPDHFSPSFCAR